MTTEMGEGPLEVHSTLQVRWAGPRLVSVESLKEVGSVNPSEAVRT